MAEKTRDGFRGEGLRSSAQRRQENKLTFAKQRGSHISVYEQLNFHNDEYGSSKVLPLVLDQQIF